jgi:hypothetical protein
MRHAFRTHGANEERQRSRFKDRAQRLESICNTHRYQCDMIRHVFLHSSQVHSSRYLSNLLQNNEIRSKERSVQEYASRRHAMHSNNPVTAHYLPASLHSDIPRAPLSQLAEVCYPSLWAVHSRSSPQRSLALPSASCLFVAGRTRGPR